MSYYDTTAAPRLAQNIRAMSTIMPDVLSRERDLAGTKWFAYRFMSPYAATQLFADLYRRGVKAYVRANWDREKAEKANGIADNVFAKASGSLTQLWQARQRADELCLPYEMIIDFGFQFASRRRWGRTPKPIQLFGSKNSDVAWPLELAKYYKDHLSMALHNMPLLPQYQVENYRRLPAQDAFREAVVEDLGEGSNWSTKIGNACIRTRHLPLRRALRLAPAGEWRAILSALRHEMKIGFLVPSAAEHVSGIAFAPACIGLVTAKDEACDDCRACSFNVVCASLADEAVSRLGSASPLAEARRAITRKSGSERQKRFRDRRKAMLVGRAATL